MKSVNRPSLGDVAEEAGVAVSVVSRILSGESTLKVRSATRARVIRIANELGYVPQYAARALRTARTETIALCIPDVMNPLFEEIRKGVELELERAGYSLMFADSDNIAL
ncbi:MAG: LacI family DNA-binding transcriptional regulator, partial [Ferrimicrobium acidiphilum]